MRHFSQLSNLEQKIAQAFIEKVQSRFKRQVVAAILFGSRARGEASPESDMDILVIVSDEDAAVRRAIHDLAVETWLEHGLFLSPVVRSREHWQQLRQLQTSFYQNICRDGIELLDPALAKP